MENSKEHYRALHVKADKKGRYLCICTAGRGIFRVGSGFHLIMIANFTIENGVCRDRHWCVNLGCKYNETTPESYAASFGYKKKLTEENKRNFYEYCNWLQAENKDFVEQIIEKWSKEHEQDRSRKINRKKRKRRKKPNQSQNGVFAS